MKKILAIIAVSAVICGCACEGWKRDVKSFKSNLHGLNRTVTLLDYQGDTIKVWKGKFDVTNVEGSEITVFDIDGKRVVIKGGILINEED